MRARMVVCVFGVVFLAACADTTAIKKFSELRPSGTEIQEAAASYQRALIDASTYDVLHTLTPMVLRELMARREAQVKLIVVNARAISQYMSELGAIAGLDTGVGRKANNDLKSGLVALQRSGKVSAQQVATTRALVDFVGGVIESGEQQHSLRKVIGEEHRDFQSAVNLEVKILENIQSSDHTVELLLGQLKYITQPLKMKMRQCRRAAMQHGTASRFSGRGCAQAYAAFLMFPTWYATQNARLDADEALAGRLKVNGTYLTASAGST